MRPIILLERRKIVAFIASIDHYIKYPPYNDTCMSICYPNVSATTKHDLRRGIGKVFAPTIGFTRAEKVRNKYYYDEVFFNLHFYIGKVYTDKKLAMTNSVDSNESPVESNDRPFSKITELSSENNDTSTLMTILTDRLKGYLDPSHITLCCFPKCYSQAKLKCSRCLDVYYCSKSCQKSHWKSHKIDCQQST